MFLFSIPTWANFALNQHDAHGVYQSFIIRLRWESQYPPSGEERGQHKTCGCVVLSFKFCFHFDWTGPAAKVWCSATWLLRYLLEKGWTWNNMQRWDCIVLMCLELLAEGRSIKFPLLGKEFCMMKENLSSLGCGSLIVADYWGFFRIKNLFFWLLPFNFC